MSIRPLAICAIALLVTSKGFAQFGGPNFGPGPGAFDRVFDRIESTVRSASQNSGSSGNNRPSMAMIDRETAKSMSYDNELKETRTYFEKRKLNREYRAAERGPRQTSADRAAIRAKHQPDRLPVSQYDAYSGQVKWPVLVRASFYDNSRSRLDILFASHSEQGGGVDTTAFAEIQKHINAIMSSLNKRYSEVDPHQYTYARKFLKSLQMESRIPVGS